MAVKGHISEEVWCSSPLISQAGYETLDGETRHLMKCFLGEYTGLVKPRWLESRALTTMKRVVNHLLEKHRYLYKGMITRVPLDHDVVGCFSTVTTILFSDGVTNWGRIASLAAFGAVVCRCLREKGNVDCVELVGEAISTYLLAEQKDWLIMNKAWDGFVEFFPEFAGNTLMTSLRSWMLMLDKTFGAMISKDNPFSRP